VDFLGVRPCKNVWILWVFVADELFKLLSFSMHRCHNREAGSLASYSGRSGLHSRPGDEVFQGNCRPVPRITRTIPLRIPIHFSLFSYYTQQDYSKYSKAIPVTGCGGPQGC
jgi:hypothetical protein